MSTEGVIGVAGSALDIKLGQSPHIENPQINSEVQEIYNALHLLSGYMGALRQNLESADGQNPAQSIRFRRTFWAPAVQPIAVGAVVSAVPGGIVNGVGASAPKGSAVDDSAASIGSTGNRTLFGVVQQQFFIALTAAAIGELVQVGVGPGVLALAGAKCGQTIWGVSAKSIRTYRDANTSPQVIEGQDFVGNGGLYLQNVTTKFYAPNPVFTYYNWEGYWLPGYPFNSGGVYHYNRAFLYPIGVCIQDGYVLFSDYKRSDPIPLRTI